MDEPEAFVSPDWSLTEKRLGHKSLYYGESGVVFVEALIARAMGDEPACHRAVARFLRASKVREGSCELTLGKSGILLGCSLLMDPLKTPSDFALRERLRMRGEQIYNEIALEMFREGRTARKDFRESLGIAHGTAGILYALLSWHDISGSEIRPALLVGLARLAKLGKKVESGVRWPLFRGKRTYWTGWCNGSAGFVFLWTLAARMLSHPGYLDLAASAAEYTWKNRNADPSLCCGAAGHGYAFLNLYRATRDLVWLKRAENAAEAAIEINGDSLFKGGAGVVALLSDLDHPETSWMPMFERAASRPQ